MRRIVTNRVLARLIVLLHERTLWVFMVVMGHWLEHPLQID